MFQFDCRSIPLRHWLGYKPTVKLFFVICSKNTYFPSAEFLDNISVKEILDYTYHMII